MVSMAQGQLLSSLAEVLLLFLLWSPFSHKYSFWSSSSISFSDTACFFPMLFSPLQLASLVSLFLYFLFFAFDEHVSSSLFSPYFSMLFSLYSLPPPPLLVRFQQVLSISALSLFLFLFLSLHFHPLFRFIFLDLLPCFLHHFAVFLQVSTAQASSTFGPTPPHYHIELPSTF